MLLRIPIVLAFLCLLTAVQAEVVFRENETLRVTIKTEKIEPVVRTALDIFKKDFKSVFQSDVVSADDGQVIVGTLGLSPELESTLHKADLKVLKDNPEGFIIQVVGTKLLVLGADKRGTAYGILELSRLIGVSPWEWWADASIVSRAHYIFEDSFKRIDYPAVAHRGIFLNDEDFGLLPWSYLTHEKTSKKGEIGGRTHERIFELLLRLRANTFWPAMHECTVAFYLTPENKKVADKYGIYIGTSHCEPMMRNTNAEWKLAGKGIYDYVNNRDNVLSFWEERVRELESADNIYTLGIRGVHDSKMLGANTLKEQQHAINNIIQDQRKMIAQFVNKDVEKVSQVFIPYKEVLDVYKLGLDIPEDVTLVWCDDNYGYIRHFPTAEEQRRSGGHGQYYHASYWGRPHDYLWLSTNHPALIYTQMKEAYNRGVKDIWVLNVGDIKPAEFTIELFLDMAWDIQKIEDSKEGLDSYILAWYSREFGPHLGEELVSVVNEYYRLAYIRKPEFMGNTRTEEKDLAYKKVKDLPWTESKIRRRIEDYDALERKVIALSAKVPAAKNDSWFQLVEYPVIASAAMNKKHLYGQLARHGKESWERSDAAWEKIVSLTDHYDDMANGKWRRMMNFKPRDLEVFHKLKRDIVAADFLTEIPHLKIINGASYQYFHGTKPKEYGLGYEGAAIHLQKDDVVGYEYKEVNAAAKSVDLAFAPNHPFAGDQLRFSVSINGQPQQIIEIQTLGRSEEWKENVLNNRTIRTVNIPKLKNGKLKIEVKALDEGIVLDQILIY